MPFQKSPSELKAPSILHNSQMMMSHEAKPVEDTVNCGDSNANPAQTAADLGILSLHLHFAGKCHLWHSRIESGLDWAGGCPLLGRQSNYLTLSPVPSNPAKPADIGIKLKTMSSPKGVPFISVALPGLSWERSKISPSSTLTNMALTVDTERAVSAFVSLSTIEMIKEIHLLQSVKAMDQQSRLRWFLHLLPNKEILAVRRKATYLAWHCNNWLKEYVRLAMCKVVKISRSRCGSKPCHIDSLL